nr:preprohepcidin 2 [Danio rerio]
MKLSNVFLAAVVILTCVCVFQITAVPFIQQVQDEHHVESEELQENQHLTEAEHRLADPLVLFRTKRQSHLSLCRFCCKCCRNKGCGYCCKF